ncbi:glycosyltransferase family 4 protein [Ekhidna sp. MALMAid0563]|uniref:glycosyltransferase family 4 protein n=1 Tax=Ekhidna sp. MALMAid0563 TaxID=3143937 RepID=UPI0032DFF2CF
MKIAYLIEWDAYAPSGVLKKIDSQIDFWKEGGHEVHLYVVFALQQKSPTLPYAQVIGSRRLHFIKASSVRNFLNKMISARKLRKKLTQFQPDILYIRQNTYYPGLAGILKSHKTIIEINTDDLSEINYYPKLKQVIWKLGRKQILNNIAGYVAVTEELRKKYVAYSCHSTVVSNAIDLKRFPVFDAASSSPAKLIFVGSPGVSWHGVDKLVELARATPEYEYHVVGPEVQDNSPSNIIWHGYLLHDELIALYARMNIAIGSLALYRYNLNEACTLKVREYAACGLPMILGHIDTDLDGKPYVLNVGNHENNTADNIGKIRSFVDFWKNKRVPRSEVEFIGTNKKEKQRLAFLEHLITNVH